MEWRDTLTITQQEDGSWEAACTVTLFGLRQKPQGKVLRLLENTLADAFASQEALFQDTTK